MKTKKYFWNRKRHRELDVRMGLVGRMNEPFAKLAEACGECSATGGTKGLTPFFPFLIRDKTLTNKMLSAGSMPYNFRGDTDAERFLRNEISVN